jgi:hypothetical protein
MVQDSLPGNALLGYSMHVNRSYSCHAASHSRIHFISHCTESLHTSLVRTYFQTSGQVWRSTTACARAGLL